MSTRVLASGTFDHFHPGHEDYLRQAKSLGDEVIVIIARDAIVRRLKGYSPQPENVRQRAVAACPYVDQAVLGALENAFDFVASLRPDIIALGYDQQFFINGLAEAMREHGLDPSIVRLEAYYPEQYKSSILTRRAVPVNLRSFH